VTDPCFDWDTVADQFDDVFQEVIAKREEEKPQIVKPKARKKAKK
jgi:5,10-methenyltetrahydromethanopterin hydrogenase